MALWPLIELLGYLKDGVTRALTVKGEVKLSGNNVAIAKDGNNVLRTDNPDNIYVYNYEHIKEIKKVIDTTTELSLYKVAVIGDSITEGGDSSDWQLTSYFGRLKDTLQSKYGDAGSGLLSFWKKTTGNVRYWSFVGVPTLDHDLGVALHPTESIEGSFNGTGCNLLYTLGSGGGIMTVTIDGVNPIEINTSDTTQHPGQHIIDGLSSGSHTILIEDTDPSNNVYVFGLIPIDGTTGIRLDNMGCHGGKISKHSYPDFSSLEFYNSPDLTIIASVSNDYFQQDNLYDYKANMSSVVDKALESGKVILLNNGLKGDYKQVNQKWYSNVLYEVANEKDVTVIDVNRKWGSYDDALSSGYFNSGNVTHPNDEGHNDMANLILDYILTQ